MNEYLSAHRALTQPASAEHGCNVMVGGKPGSVCGHASEEHYERALGDLSGRIERICLVCWANGIGRHGGNTLATYFAGYDHGYGRPIRREAVA